MLNLTAMALVLLLASPARAGLEVAFQGCDENQIRKLTNAHERNAFIVDDLFRQIDRARVEYPQHARRLTSARNMLACLSGKLPNLVYQCTELDGADGWTVPLVGTLVKIDNDAINNQNWGRSNYISSIMIHEAAHKCGATDSLYIHQNRAPGPRSTRFTEWMRIASTYQYWVIWGFCVPYENCPERAP